MTGMQVNRLVIVCAALGLACAACARAEPARAPASSAQAPADSSTDASVAPPGRPDSPDQPPRLVSSHGPLPGIMPAAGAEAGAPGGVAAPAGASPHGAMRWDAPAG